MPCRPGFHLPVWSFHLDSPLGPLPYSPSKVWNLRADSTLRCPSRIDQSEKSIPQRWAQKEHVTHAGLMRSNPKTSAKNHGEAEALLLWMPSWQIVPQEQLGNILPSHRERQSIQLTRRKAAQRDGERQGPDNIIGTPGYSCT